MATKANKMAIAEHPVLDVKEPKRMKCLDEYLQDQGGYTFSTSIDGKCATAFLLADSASTQNLYNKNGPSVNNAITAHEEAIDRRVPRSNAQFLQLQSVKDSYHAVLGQKLPVIPKGLALVGFSASKADDVAQGLTMPLAPVNNSIPSHLKDSFILANPEKLPQVAARASAAPAGAFDQAHVDTVRPFGQYGHAVTSGSHALLANHSSAGIKFLNNDSAEHKLNLSISFLKPTTPLIAATTPAAAATSTVTKRDGGTGVKGGHNDVSDSNESPDTSNASEASEDSEACSDQSVDQDDMSTGNAAGDDKGGSSDHESSSDESSDEDSSDESSDEEAEDDTILGLAKVRALNLAPGVAFENSHGIMRWPCNQCHRNYSRRDEARRHLRFAHYATLYDVVPEQKGLEQARIDCP